MTTSGQARTVSHSLLALGAFGMLAAVGRGLSTGRLFELGSNNLVLFLAALAVALLGWALRHQRLADRLARALAWSAGRTPEFLSRLTRRRLLYMSLGVWFGVAQGLAEWAYRAYHDPVAPWRHAVWLGPLTYGVLFGVVGLCFAATAGWDPAGRRHLRLAVWLLLTMSGIGLLRLALPQVYPLATTLLAAGVAAQVARLLVAHAHVLGIVLHGGRWALGSTLLVTTIWALGSDALDARQARDPWPEPPGGARNVLLIVLDTVRAQSLSLYEYERRTTPTLEQWSERAVVFESAMSTAPWTLTSHAGMFTGRWAHELGSDWMGSLDDRFPTVAEVMRDRGYATAGFVANLVFTTRQTGLARGFDQYEDFTIGVGEAILSTSLGRALVTSDWLRNTLQYHELANRKVAPSVSADFLDWLDRTNGRPFFAFLNYFDAHEPYLPPGRFAELFRPGRRVHRGPFRHFVGHAGHADWWSLSPDQIANERALYDAAIAWQDHEIGRLFEELDRRGVLGHTVVIVTSDHGEHFGEHDLFSHGHNLYMPQVHVPLWILMPEAIGPRRVTETVSLRDIPNTVLDLAGLTRSPMFPGASLARFWSPRPTPVSVEPMHISLFPAAGADTQPTPAAKGPMRSIIEDPHHYILNGDGVEELFDYRSDTLEQWNLVGTPGTEALLARFRAMVETQVLPSPQWSPQEDQP